MNVLQAQEKIDSVNEEVELLKNVQVSNSSMSDYENFQIDTHQRVGGPRFAPGIHREGGLRSRATIGVNADSAAWVLVPISRANPSTEKYITPPACHEVLVPSPPGFLGPGPAAQKVSWPITCIVRERRPEGRLVTRDKDLPGSELGVAGPRAPNSKPRSSAAAAS